MRLVFLIVATLQVVANSGWHGAQFQCDDGLHYVSWRKSCDGTIDCPDGSDEYLNNCLHSKCWSQLWFRCGSGGCIPRTRRCDGQVDCWDGSDEAHCPRMNNYISCSKEQFQCRTGNCVPFHAACNGTSECRDGSDETAMSCHTTVQCPETSFRCGYGACISKSLVCDGIFHCYDGSDEWSSICKGACKVPKVSSPLRVTTPGCVGACTEIQDLNRVLFSCDLGYDLIGPEFAMCQYKMWQPPELPACVPIWNDNLTCPGLKLTPEVNGICTLPSGEMSYCIFPQPAGTRARVYCLQNSRQRTDAYCQYDGHWSVDPPICTPNWGLSSAQNEFKPSTRWRNSSHGLELKLIPLIVGGSLSSRGQWPWHVALYVLRRTEMNETDWRYQCGGTLVSDTAVITAAHCVHGKSANELQVVLGKYQRQYNISESDAQYMQIRQILLPEAYLGDINGFDSDIAMLTFVQRAVFTPFIRPACLDWTQTAVKTQLTSGSSGILAGWGLTETDQGAQELRSARLNFIPTTECLIWVKADFRRYIRTNTFCAGTKNGTSACNGDSGGGLMFSTRDSGPWTLQGVVSLSIRREGAAICNSRFPTVFTRVANFMSDYILPWMYQATEPWLMN